jgi:DNA-binding NarL/FixJ family response regulator
MTISVLVIDDDEVFRALVVRALEGMGLRVVGEAATAEAGAVAAAKLRPRAALVDVALPDGSGVELATELAALPWKPRVVLTSNDRSAVSEPLVRNCGAVAFIAKEELPDARLHALLAGEPQV